jgi:TrmH family RNA methyltransferase
MGEIPIITSVSNAMVKHAHSLTVPKKLKDSPDLLCEGFHLVTEAFRSGVRVRFVLATARALSGPVGAGILEAAGASRTKVFEVPDKIVGYLSETAAPQGIVAVAEKPVLKRPEALRNCGLVLYEVQDPGNVGTLMRSAEAFGAEALFLSEGTCDPFNPKVVRASMGSLFRVPFEHGVEPRGLMEWARSAGAMNAALVQGGDMGLPDIPRDRPILFWAGAEGAGLPDAIVGDCEARVRIPMAGSVESLNVGVAASLALFYKAFGRPVP